MKKILNDPIAYVDEMLEGLCAAYPEHYVRLGSTGRVIARAVRAPEGKVGIVSLGGSGHLPLFTGYVGRGLLDACAIGDVFSSPPVDLIVEAIRTADNGAGVLCLFGNYTGDTMNCEMACEMIEMEGIKTTIVKGADDVASAPPPERAKRRGVAGLLYAYKLAGAAAEAMADLDEVTAVAATAADACRSVGVALTPCTVPAAGKPTFSLGEDEMEIGMGIHGEPGVQRGPLGSADDITEDMLKLLLAEVPLASGARVGVLVNSLGATPLEELHIVYRYVARKLADTGVKIVMPLVGRYATSMEMTGMSISLCMLDEKLEKLLTAPCDCPYLKV